MGSTSVEGFCHGFERRASGREAILEEDAANLG